MKRLLEFSAALLLLSVGPIYSTAQTFPTKPITMLVVFAPGGATDVLARLVADHMSRTLGQRVIVENVSGAGGTIGGARGAQAEPDGYTLTVGSLGSHSAAPSIYRSIKYDPRELDPIGVIAGTPLYFVVRNDFPAKNFQEFQSYVKANPGKVTNGHAGVGSTNHLACLLLMHITKLEFNSVAYRGEGPAIQDLIAGHVEFRLHACACHRASYSRRQSSRAHGSVKRAGRAHTRHAERAGGRCRPVHFPRLECDIRAEGNASTGTR